MVILAPLRALWSATHVGGVARTARDVLNELRWRGGFDLSQAEVWIADRTRPEGGRVLSGADIVDLGRKYFSTATAVIPFYKVLRIVYEGRILFERKSASQDS